MLNKAHDSNHSEQHSIPGIWSCSPLPYPTPCSQKQIKCCYSPFSGSESNPKFPSTPPDIFPSIFPMMVRPATSLYITEMVFVQAMCFSGMLAVGDGPPQPPLYPPSHNQRGWKAKATFFKPLTASMLGVTGST